MKLLIANLFSFLCVGIAAYLLINDIGHWGWFIFLALLSLHTYSSNDGDEK